jgi:hypothetical protein
MRHFTTTLFFCFFSTFAAFSQEAAPAPAPSPAALEAKPVEGPAEAQVTETLSINDQEFLQVPGDPGQPAEGILTEQDLSLTGEIPAPIESDRDFVDPNADMPGHSTDISAIDPRSAAPSDEEQDRKLKIAYREVRTKAEKDAAITSLREQAEAAKTFEGERAAYREYYRALFKKMKQLDKSLTKKCDLMEKAYLYRLAQNRIEPTIPLEPPPKPQPLAN